MPDPAVCDGLVLDTSVWINLLATDAIEIILRALPTPCFAPEQVVAEVRRHPVSGQPFLAEPHPLRVLPNISVVALAAAEQKVFLGIVGAPAPDALGDGEAAAIAVAAERGFGLVIDDRKARRIVRERFPQVPTYWTVELLLAPAIVGALGLRQCEDHVAKARQHGRMHMPRR